MFSVAFFFWVIGALIFVLFADSSDARVSRLAKCALWAFGIGLFVWLAEGVKWAS